MSVGFGASSKFPFGNSPVKKKNNNNKLLVMSILCN